MKATQQIYEAAGPSKKELREAERNGFKPTKHTPNMVICHCGTRMVSMSCPLHDAAPALLAAAEHALQFIESIPGGYSNSGVSLKLRAAITAAEKVSQ